MTSLSALNSIDERRHFRAADRVGAGVSALRTDVVRTREAFDAMAHQWQGLERQADGAVLFQGSGWARAIFDFEARRGNTAFDPEIFSSESPASRARSSTRSPSCCHHFSTSGKAIRNHEVKESGLLFTCS